MIYYNYFTIIIITDIPTLLVRLASERAATAGGHLVRRPARFSAQSDDRTTDSGGETRRHVSGVQYDLFDGADVGEGSLHEEAVR